MPRRPRTWPKPTSTSFYSFNINTIRHRYPRRRGLMAPAPSGSMTDFAISLSIVLWHVTNLTLFGGVRMMSTPGWVGSLGGAGHGFGAENRVRRTVSGSDGWFFVRTGDDFGWPGPEAGVFYGIRAAGRAGGVPVWTGVRGPGAYQVWIFRKRRQTYSFWFWSTSMLSMRWPDSGSMPQRR